MEKKKVIIACTRRRVSESIQKQLENMLGDYADVRLLLINEEQVGKIYCDLVIAISEEVAGYIAPYLMGNTEIIVMHLTIRRDMYQRLDEIAGEKQAIVVNNTQELALETVAVLYALHVKNIELYPYFPGCKENYSHIKLAITPNEVQKVPSYIQRIIDIGERCLDPLTVIDIFSRLDCLTEDAIEMIFDYGQRVISVNRGITELTGNGHDFGFSRKQFADGFDDPVLLTDSDGKIALFNSAAQSLFSESYEHLNGWSIEELGVCPEKNGDILKNIKETPIEIKGKIYLMTCHSIGGAVSCGTMVHLKSMEKIWKLYARYGYERAKHGKLKYTFEDIIGSSSAMRELRKKGKRFAETDFPILIQGESGTGKELFAQAIHQASRRRNGPFIAFNCAALTDSLLESELFGYSRGAFTGALREGRAGLFEQASGGTLFMDEIGDISLALQAKILRVLQEQEIVRVGGSEVIPVDIRIISATNRNLQEAVREKKFRLDLYYRLNTLILKTVPLKERPADIADMLAYFFEKMSIKKTIEKDAMDCLTHYSWPGNVRELQNCVSYLSILDNDIIQRKDLPEWLMEENEMMLDEDNDAVVKSSLTIRKEILYELKKCMQNGKKIGRKSLKDTLNKGGTILSEAEIREYLEEFNQQGLVISEKGRGGTRITEKGLERLKEMGI